MDTIIVLQYYEYRYCIYQKDKIIIAKTRLSVWTKLKTKLSSRIIEKVTCGHHYSTTVLRVPILHLPERQDYYRKDKIIGKSHRKSYMWSADTTIVLQYYEYRYRILHHREIVNKKFCLITHKSDSTLPSLCVVCTRR